jgi:ABC-type nickel/cobalt efflux system permease component RcnA
MIEKPSITMEYSLSYSEFVAGHKLAVRQSIPLLAFHIFARYIASAVALVLIALAVINIASGHAETVPGILPIIVLVCIIPATIWVSWRIGFRRLKIDPAIDPHMTFQADGTSFARQIQKMGDVTWLWSATHSIAQNKKVVLISVRKGCFIVLPRRVVSDAQLAELKSCLAQAKVSQC